MGVVILLLACSLGAAWVTMAALRRSWDWVLAAFWCVMAWLSSMIAGLDNLDGLGAAIFLGAVLSGGVVGFLLSSYAGHGPRRSALHVVAGAGWGLSVITLLGAWVSLL
ncbi:hypothetical protein [Paracoccus sp. (in: a-proteobacteria)]|uniref:hypothetical protein n=1 Tax=Paracoccus sp. TaxID=267 RepID=UPI0026DFD3E9|nr:hypothetical protein [Paracoccus sp. (in: a-proteobacteria)]MDO5648223.1 hypothetical protein [Paracoccus sp. (in: a-proteobacteria)]